MAAVGIIPFGAVGGDLVNRPIDHNADGAVLFAAAHQGVPRKDLGDGLRLGGGAKVIIVGNQPQKGITHAAADGIAGKPFFFQGFDANMHIRRQIHGIYSLISSIFMRNSEMMASISGSVSSVAASSAGACSGCGVGSGRITGRKGAAVLGHRFKNSQMAMAR